MIYWCKPLASKCEWIKLRPFVEHYNSVNGKHYSLSRCLDVAMRSRPEPEILLEALGEIPAVIEHKAIVWPELYFREHQNEHTFFDLFSESIGPHCQDDLYRLTISDESIRGKKKAEIQSLAKSLTEEVIRNSKFSSERGRIDGQIPFPWLFERVPTSHRLPDMPSAGVGLQVDPHRSHSLGAILKAHEEARAGFGQAFERAARRAAKKFENYPDHLALLVVEFFGEGSTWILDDDLFEAIGATELSKSIDEVWIMRREWPSDNDFELAWERAR